MGKLNPDTGLFWCRGFDHDPHECPREDMCKEARERHGIRTICKACMSAYNRSPQGRDRDRKHAGTEKRRASYRRHDAKRNATEKRRAERRVGGPGHDAVVEKSRRRRARRRGAETEPRDTRTARERRGLIFAKTGGTCYTCGCSLDRYGKWIADHVVSLAEGGCDCVANLAPQCETCSARKWNRPFNLAMVFKLFDGTVLEDDGLPPGRLAYVGDVPGGKSATMSGPAADTFTLTIRQYVP